MADQSGRKEFVARRLFEIGAIGFREERYHLAIHEKHPQAPLSPFYIDLRLLRSYPRLLNDVAGLIVEATPTAWEELDCLSDVPVAATPIVTLVSQKTGIPMISPRLSPKGHGVEGKILGAWEPGQRVGIIDDLRTTGGSKEAVIALYEQHGLKVTRVVALVDRGSPEGAPVAGRPFSAVYAWSGLLQFYRSGEIIPASLHERCVEYPNKLAAHLAGCRGCA